MVSGLVRQRLNKKLGFAGLDLGTESMLPLPPFAPKGVW